MKPKLNQFKSNFSTRYVMGIEGIAPSMSNEVSPVVSTVTPRPYYWAFFTWCYYDYFTNDVKNIGFIKSVDEYIRRNNYFIALGSVLKFGPERDSFIGVDSIGSAFYTSKDVYEYNPYYVKGLSTMRNYQSGIFDGERTMNLILNQNIDTGDRYNQPKITPTGIDLAKAFEEVIKETQYYKEYRTSDRPVPKTVLLELGELIRIDSRNFPECIRILKDCLFEKQRLIKLRESKDYLKHIHDDIDLKLATLTRCRKTLFDTYSIFGEQRDIPEELHDISTEWEVIIGRQYFVIGLQIIFKYMLDFLVEPMHLNTWVTQCIRDQEYSFDLNDTLQDVLELKLDEPLADFEHRERIMTNEMKQSGRNSVENGLRVLLMIYNRFHDREDLSEMAKSFLHSGERESSVSMAQFFAKADEYLNNSVSEFIALIMKEFIVYQHMDTAFGKMINTHIDGYYIEEIDKRYRRRHAFDFGFQGLRMVQLTSVMNDLECF